MTPPIPTCALMRTLPRLAGVFNIVPGDGPTTGSALINHPLLDKVRCACCAVRCVLCAGWMWRWLLYCWALSWVVACWSALMCHVSGCGVLDGGWQVQRSFLGWRRVHGKPPHPPFRAMPHRLLGPFFRHPNPPTFRTYQAINTLSSSPDSPHPSLRFASPPLLTPTLLPPPRADRLHRVDRGVCGVGWVGVGARARINDTGRLPSTAHVQERMLTWPQAAYEGPVSPARAGHRPSILARPATALSCEQAPCSLTRSLARSFTHSLARWGA